MAFGRLRSQLSRVGYRELLDIPGIARVHDYQRVFSYGLGAVAMLTIGAGAWRTTTVLLLCGVMTAG